MIIKGYLYGVLYAVLCLAVAFVLYKVGVAKKITRKIVHILVGAEWIILYHFFGPSIHFLAVCLLFLIVLAISHRKNLMPMISSDGDNAPGTVYYAVAMSVMAIITLFIPDMILPFGIGVFCTSLGDGFAGLVGQSITAGWNKKVYGNKTLVGAAVNLLSCFGVALAFDRIFNLGLSVWHCIAIAILGLELELFTGLGLDNISITLGTSYLSYFFVSFPGAENYVVPILLTPAIIAFAYKKKALTVSGIIAAIILDVVISISLGNLGFIILLIFFVGGIAVDKIKKSKEKCRQKEKSGIEKRGSCRDHVQVLANGSVAALCAILYLIIREDVFVIAFVASLAEALADTVASGIGVLHGRAFDPFRMKPCTPGVSGGMSLMGTSASAVAALIVATISLAFEPIGITSALIIALSAILGGIFDSFLGSLLQVKYKCTVCCNITEREEHCGVKTQKHSGIRFINNDTVNLLGTLFAASISAVLYLLIK